MKLLERAAKGGTRERREERNRGVFAPHTRVQRAARDARGDGYAFSTRNHPYNPRYLIRLSDTPVLSLDVSQHGVHPRHLLTNILPRNTIHNLAPVITVRSMLE